MYLKFCAFILLVFLFGCNDDRGRSSIASTKVNVHLENAYNQKLVFQNLPYFNGEVRKLDSANLKDRVEIRVFQLNDSVQNLYEVRIANSPVKIVFINDAPEIDIYIDFFNPEQFRIEKSPASKSLHDFFARMNLMARSGSNFDPVPFTAGAQVSEQQLAYRNFIDTVSSPASALYVFSAIDYGNDYAALKKLVNNLHKRYPGHTGIDRLKKETDDYISIFEQELQINDTAPDLVLPDTSGKEIALSSFKGKYILLDFWAAWHGNSRIKSSDKLRAWETYKRRNFIIVSISLDPDLVFWKKVIVQDKYQWPQLNDSHVWTGKSIKTYKFDSIPFNYLIDPTGRIIAKAIYGDSLRKKLSEILP